MKKYDAVFFDFDGVILDSVDCKTEAFKALYRPFGKEIEKLVESYHLKHGGVSRYEKFKYFQKNLLKSDYSKGKINQLADEFSKLVFEQVLKAPYLDGALSSLKKLKEEEIPCFVVSGTPEIELHEIMQKRDLDKFFKSAYGSPKDKTTILRLIFQKNNFSPVQCLFIGDAMTDFIAAQNQNIPFLGIVKEGSSSPFPKTTNIKTSVSIF